MPGTRQVRGGNTYTFHRPVRPDDVVTATWEIHRPHREDDRRRAATCSSSARRATYTNQDGDLLAATRRRIIFVRWTVRDDAGCRRRCCRRWSARSTLVDMVAYAGATWDWYRLHYDRDFVAAERVPGARWSTARCSARCSPSWCRTGSGRSASCASCRSRFRTSCSPGRRVALRRGTVVDRRGRRRVTRGPRRDDPSAGRRPGRAPRRGAGSRAASLLARPSTAPGAS